MDFLIELLKIVNKRKIQNIEIYDKSMISNKDSLFTKLYDGILEGKINNDKTAAEYLYKSKNENIKFRQLKSRFKKRLLNTLFFLDLNNSNYDTDIQKKYYECLKSVHSINIVQKYGSNRKVINQIIQDNYAIALKNNFFDVLKEFSFHLITYYGLIGNDKKLNIEIERFNYYKKQLDAELEARIYYSRVNSIFQNKKLNEDKLKTILQLLEKNAEDSGLIISKFHLSITKILYYEYLYDIVKISDECDYILEKIKAKDFLYKQNFIGIVIIYKIKTFLQLHKYEEGIKYIQENINYFIGLNWFIAKELEFRFALNSKKIDIIDAVFDEVFSNKSFNSAPNYIKEKWYIFEAYHVFYQNYLTKGNYKYNLGKLSNQVPLYFHDKSGYNFSLLIIQILYYLARKDVENASVKIQSLSIYKNRYFTDESYFRTRLFIKTLEQIDKDGYSKRKSNLLLPQFINSKKSNKYIHDHEIIIFESLLEIIIEIM